jgi:hypothetical protein
MAIDLTINVPVVYIKRDRMILMRSNPLQGPLDGAGPENRDFLDPEKKSRFIHCKKS